MSWSVSGYTEIEELGRGASGRVVLAEHQGTGTKVAIKYLADHLTHDADFVEAFRAEARILSEVEDPQVARLYEYVEAPEGSAIVMELVDGVALRAILREHGPTEPQSALVVLKGSLLGLAATHGHGIVHRDYKPENVLVNREGQSKLADFGIAARAGLRGVHAGTPSYMAPEQWAGAPASPATDIYAATATFFECLTGHPPYRSPGDLLGLRGKHELAPIPADEVPEAVRGLVRRGLAKKSEQRPKDAATFLVELEAVAGAGYGPDWEEEGRGALARRAALLLLLFPLAGAAAGGTGVAQTILGWSKKSMNTVLAGALAAAIAIAAFVWYQTSQDDVTLPSAAFESSSPTATVAGVVLTPSPTPTDTPSPSPSASASPSASPSKSKSPSPSPTPPRPNEVQRIYVPQYNSDFPRRDGFCWISSGSCQIWRPYSGSVVRVPISFATTTGGAFKLKLRYTPVDANGKQMGTPVVREHTVLAGQTQATFTDNLSNVPCAPSSGAGPVRLMLTVSASIPGPQSEPVYVDNICVVG